MCNDLTDTPRKEYQTAFETAERYLKEAELFVKDMEGLSGDDLQGLLFPAVNELRYAGCHAVRAMTKEGDKQDEAYKEATRHCQRACYDALDAQIQFCLGECRRFQRDYELVVIGNVIQGYQDDCLKLKRYNQMEARDTDRDQYWEGLVSIVADMRDTYSKWTIGREELNKVLEEKRNTRWQRFLSSYGIIISTVAAVTSAVCAVYVLFRG